MRFLSTLLLLFLAGSVFPAVTNTSRVFVFKEAAAKKPDLMAAQNRLKFLAMLPESDLVFHAKQENGAWVASVEFMPLSENTILPGKASPVTNVDGKFFCVDYEYSIAARPVLPPNIVKLPDVKVSFASNIPAEVNDFRTWYYFTVAALTNTLWETAKAELNKKFPGKTTNRMDVNILFPAVPEESIDGGSKIYTVNASVKLFMAPSGPEKTVKEDDSEKNMKEFTEWVYRSPDLTELKAEGLGYAGLIDKLSCYYAPMRVSFDRKGDKTDWISNAARFDASGYLCTGVEKVGRFYKVGFVYSLVQEPVRPPEVKNLKKYAVSTNAVMKFGKDDPDFSMVRYALLKDSIVSAVRENIRETGFKGDTFTAWIYFADLPEYDLKGDTLAFKASLQILPIGKK